MELWSEIVKRGVECVESGGVKRNVKSAVWSGEWRVKCLVKSLVGSVEHAV